jgi:hypothetical protein
MKRSTVNILASYIDALHPIIYINHFDFKVIDDAIARVGKGVKCVEFNNALGIVDFYNKSPMKECDLEQFLKLTMDDGFEQETFIVLKDVHGELNSPKIISLLKRIAENNLYNDEYSATIFILSETIVIPKELENYITVFDIPLPTTSEILTIINDFVADMDIVVDQEAIDEIARKALKQNTGARSLRSILEQFMLGVMFEIPQEKNKYKLVITKEMVLGEEKAKIKENTGG